MDKNYPDITKRISGSIKMLRKDIAETMQGFSAMAQAATKDGALDKKTLRDEYAKAAIYVACSHEEGWGISIYQALASGHEVFALDLPCYARVAEYAHFYQPHQLAEMAADIAACDDVQLAAQAM